MPRRTVALLAPFAATALLLSTACGGGAAPTSKPAAQSGATSAPAKPAAAAAGDPAKGKTLYDGTCSSCHGPDAKGLPNLGKDITTSAFVKSETDAQLVAFIKTGRPASDPANTTKVDMPPKGGNPTLTDAQILDIVAYVRTVNK